MPIPELWVIVLSFGAAARLTRLVTRDTIFSPLRDWVARRYGDDSLRREFIGCPWCIGFWISAVIALLAYCPAISHHPAFYITASALTLSYLVGLAARWLD